MPDWRVEQYSFSASLFNHICQKYLIVEVHFITSALKRVLNDIDLLSATNSVKTTIKRKHDWMKSGMIYNAFLKQYILEKITDAVKVISDKKNI